MDRNVVLPKIASAGTAGVREIVERSTAKSKEMVIAAFQGTKLWQCAQMPFADQRRAITGFLQQRRESRMFRGKAHTCVTNQGLLQAYPQAILVAASD